MVSFALAALALALPLASASPVSAAAAASNFWLPAVVGQGAPAFGTAGYKVFRNVSDYGAKGDGATDDTDAINRAIADGSRCGKGCQSSTTTPALVWFPAGTYVVSKPIQQLYYTQFVGDPNNVPTIKAAAAFTGMAVIDADPYDDSGNNYWINQNNFFRQIRNFVIDTTAIPDATAASGIHWQVAQATSLQNIRFEMTRGASSNQQGIFMDNGSGGFMTDLVFNGGKYGAFFGNQQFTTRNLTFNGCQTAVFMNWNWLWALQSLSINDCQVGIDMAVSPANQTVGSVLLSDSVLTNTPIGVNTSFSTSSQPTTGGTLLIDNVDFGSATNAVQSYTGQPLLAGGGKVVAWAQGNVAGLGTGSNTTRVQGAIANFPTKPASLTAGADGAVFQRSRPQYEALPASAFVSLKAHGAKGDGKTDDTAAIQAAIDGFQDGTVLFFDHGAYLLTQTLTIPAGKHVRITGEVWPHAHGHWPGLPRRQPSRARDPRRRVARRAGHVRDERHDRDHGRPRARRHPDGVEHCRDGPGRRRAVGRALPRWRLRRVADPGRQLRQEPDGDARRQARVRRQLPAAAHDGRLDGLPRERVAVDRRPRPSTTSTTTTRRSTSSTAAACSSSRRAPVWLWGTASEHSQLTQYTLAGAKDIFWSIIQTETPYYQPNPAATGPFASNTAFFDPDFANCKAPGGCSAWALRLENSTSVWGYGSGTYSFFQNYEQSCVNSQTCQDNMIAVDGSSDVNLFGVSTKAAVNMVTVDGHSAALDADNRNNFCATLVSFAVP